MRRDGDDEGTVTIHKASELVALGAAACWGAADDCAWAHASTRCAASGAARRSMATTSPPTRRTLGVIDLGEGRAPLRTWVSGGQIVEAPADAAALVPDARGGLVPGRKIRPCEAVAIVPVDEAAWRGRCVGDDKREHSVPVGDVLTRLDSSFRVPRAAGFQRATLIGFTPDGMYQCRFAGGTVRWVAARSPPEPSGRARHPSAGG